MKWSLPLPHDRVSLHRNGFPESSKACKHGDLVGPREGNDIFSALTANVFGTAEGLKVSLSYIVKLHISCSCKEA